MIFRLRAALVAAVVLTAPVLGAPTASAGTGATAGLTLVSQSPWTVLGGDLQLGLRAPGATAGMTLSVVAHQALTSRSAFERTSDGERLGSVLDQVELPVEALTVDDTGARRVALGLEAPGSARDVARLSVRRTGVYPLAIELRSAEGETLAGFTSYLVAVEPGLGGATPLEQRLGVAWVWPLSAPPGRLPDGQVDPVVADALGPTGRLGRQVAALARAPDVPVTVVPGPETVQLWAALARDDPTVLAGVTGLRNLFARTQVVASPYVPVDLPSLLAAGLTSAVDAELLQGDAALRRFFGARGDVRTALTRPVAPTSLTRLRAAGVDRVIVASGALAAASERSAPVRPFLLDAPAPFVSGSTVDAVASDDGISSLLAGEGSAALRSQRVLAALSVVALESPESDRAVVLVSPETLDAPAAMFDALLAGLRGHPWLAPTTVAGVFDGVPAEAEDNDTAAVRELAPYPAPAPAVSALAFDDAHARLRSFESLLPADDGRAVAAEHALLSSVSSAWNAPGAAPRARAELGAIDAAIGAFLAQIKVPDPATITLTSRAGEIPLTFRNDTGQTVSVLVELESQKLSFPDGSSLLVDLPPRSTTVRVPVEARTSGSFPLGLSVHSADGVLRISDTRFRVRSTAVSTAGIALMIGAGVFLAVWWGFDIRRRRRARMAPAAS